MITGDKDHQRILKLDSTYLIEGMSPAWYIECRGLSHDGTDYGYVDSEIKVASFPDNKLISDLNIYPLKYCENREAVRDRLIARGKKFCSLTGCHYQSYTGLVRALGSKLDSGSNGQKDAYPLETTMVYSSRISRSTSSAYTC